MKLRKAFMLVGKGFMSYHAEIECSVMSATTGRVFRLVRRNTKQHNFATSLFDNKNHIRAGYGTI